MFLCISVCVCVCVFVFVFVFVSVCGCTKCWLFVVCCTMYVTYIYRVSCGSTVYLLKGPKGLIRGPRQERQIVFLFWGGAMCSKVRQLI